MGVMGRIKCVFGRHLRSQGKAREVEGEFVSVCKFCGVPMRRDYRRKWHVDRSIPMRDSAAR